jgi:hypothetical protein
MRPVESILEKGGWKTGYTGRGVIMAVWREFQEEA